MDNISDNVWQGFRPNGGEMKFRLSQQTRTLAKCYLSGEIGSTILTVQEFNAQADAHGQVRMEIPSDFYLQVPSPPRLYARAVREIAEKAPLRIIPDEKLVGAATLQEASTHMVPVLGVRSVSHITIGFEHALSAGCNGLRKEIELRLARGGMDADGVELLNAMLNCLDSHIIWKSRYLAEAKKMGLDGIVRTLERIPENPPRNFREAVQALWLFWDFQRLCGNWSGIGRIDKMLGPYLRADLQKGSISLAEARELLAHFWIKGCEWIGAKEIYGSGDAQYFQNVILGGFDENGDEITNEVTFLILDVVEELHISDFPISVRLNSKSSDELLRRVAQIQKLGGGIIAVYNEDIIISSLVKFGYPLHDARNFANDGCWEILIPGKSAFTYQEFDALYILQESLGLNRPESPVPSFGSFEELYQDFRIRFAQKLTELLNDNKLFGERRVTVLIDLLVDGCIESGRSFYESGPRYSVVSPHPGGLPDVVNSLLSIEKLVYTENKYTLAQMVDILRRDWDGEEEARRGIREHGEFYGNDSEKADRMLQRVYNDYTDLAEKAPYRCGALRPAGISTFGRECADFRVNRTASAAGTHKGDILAANFSPSPGTDRKGPTAVLKSHCCVDFSKLPCGTALDLKLPPAALSGEQDEEILMAIMKSFVRLGGIFMQIDVVDTELLRQAQEHPENYPNLVVRVSGWSARFATLDRNWKELIIKRSEQRMQQ